MRKSKIFKLKWENVDFKDRIIKIIESKSGKGRIVPMNSIVFEVLSALRRLDGKDEFVFVNPSTGNPYVDIKRAFNGACKKAGIDDFHLHDTRHSFASRLVKKNVDLMIVKELLGHASVVTTQRYLHSQEKEKLQAVETLTNNQYEKPLECQTGVKSYEKNLIIDSFSAN